MFQLNHPPACSPTRSSTCFILQVIIQDVPRGGLPDFCQSHFHLVYILRLAPHVKLAVHESDDQQIRCMTRQVGLRYQQMIARHFCSSAGHLVGTLCKGALSCCSCHLPARFLAHYNSMLSSDIQCS